MGQRTNTIDSLYPPFAELIVKHLKRIQEEELHAYLFETYRSFERQLELYSQGREKNAEGQWVVVNKTKVVTKALPGKSWHAYGLAVDYAFDGNIYKEGIQWTWEDADATKEGNQPLPWQRLGELGEECGLEWAGNWKSFREYPHFQNLFGFTLKDLYPILASEGIEAVWEKLDEKVRPMKNIVVVPTTIITPPKEVKREDLVSILMSNNANNTSVLPEPPANWTPNDKKIEENKVEGVGLFNLIIKILKVFFK